MPDPLLIIVTGLPATGKTTLAGRLARDLRLPFVYKDLIKESLYESLGVGDQAWSHRLAIAAYDLLYIFMEANLKAGRSLVVESNFRPDISSGEMKKLQRRYPFRTLQVVCYADTDVIYQRYQERAGSPDRHPGHLDHEALPRLRSALPIARQQALHLDGPIFEVDTTDFDALNYEALLESIRLELDPLS